MVLYHLLGAYKVLELLVSAYLAAHIRSVYKLQKLAGLVEHRTSLN